MSFNHVTVVNWKALAPNQPAVFALGEQGEELCYTGFNSTQEMLVWLAGAGDIGDCTCLVGEWEVDDAGSKYNFDGEDVHAGDSWEQFKAEHAEHRLEAEEDSRRWREAIAREEGMLNGIDSYNDWMGC